LIEGARDEHDCLSCWASQRDAASLDGVQRDGMIRVTGTIRDVSKIGSTLEDCTFEPYQTNDT
ncbi:MAG TPA: hypothetical protein VH254_03770, partial [Candidatus Udaeobacter sp.]|nr:hypothetical protein [Candidatus Udaeobacter sp.]